MSSSFSISNFALPWVGGSEGKEIKKRGKSSVTSKVVDTTIKLSHEPESFELISLIYIKIR